MSQQLSPWLEGAYGWNFGESGWNSGMDQNLLKFSFLFDRNVDSIVASLPPAVNGQAHYLTTDNRLYFAVGTTYFSTVVPKWFTVVVRATGATWQYNGTALVQQESLSDLDSRLDAVELTIASLGSAAFEDVAAFATSAELDVVEGQAQAYTDVLRQDLANATDPAKGAGLVGRAEQVVDSIVELRLLDKTAASKDAFVTGYYAQGDGGGGAYYLDIADATSIDDGGAVIVAADGGRWKLVDTSTVNVRQFGAAVAASATVNSTAITAAMSVSGVVEFGSRGLVFEVNTLSVPDGVTLSAEGATLRAATGQVNLLNLTGNNTIRGLRIVNNQTSGCIGVNLSANAKNILIEANIFECEAGFAMQGVSVNALGVTDVQVLRNQFINTRYGFLSNANAEDFSRCVISDNLMRGIKADGIELNHPIHLTGLGSTPRPLPAYQSGRDITISGNVIEGDPASDQPICLGIGIAGATNVSVSGNVVKSFRGRGIHIEDEARHISVVGNVVDGTSANPLSTDSDGIHILGGQDIIVSGNTVLNANDNGIHCVAGAGYSDGEFATPRNVIITGNIVRGAGATGIKLAGSSSTYDNNYMVQDNIITGCVADAVSIVNSSNRVSLKGNRLIGNTGFAVSVVGIHPGSWFDDNLTEGNVAGRYSFSSMIMPIPSRGERSLFKVVADGAGTTPATSVFNLGKGASGTMTVIGRTTDGAATGMRTYNITWDGTTLTATTAYSFIVSMSFATPTMSGTSIQISATNAGASKTVLFDISFVGSIAAF